MWRLVAIWRVSTGVVTAFDRPDGINLDPAALAELAWSGRSNNEAAQAKLA